MCTLQKCAQSVLGVCGVFEDGGSSPLDSLQSIYHHRGQRSPDGLLRSCYHSLQAFAVHSSWSADLILGAHAVAEPRPDQLQQPQIIALPPQACTVGTRHDGCITSSASLPTLMHPSLWNRVNLDSSDHMTFFQCSRVPSLCSLVN